MDLSLRADLPELMDAADLDPAVYNRCLRDLAALNRITLTHRATLRWLSGALKVLPPGKEVSVLDVAYGQGDLLRAIAGWAAKRGLKMRLSGIDLNPRSALAARAATKSYQNIDYYTGDVFAYAPDDPVDFIVSSQFAHHLPDADVVRLLGWMDAHARCGWMIADLQRHPFPYYGFRLLAWLMLWHRIVRLDGTVSIARSFTRADWRRLLTLAGLPAKISWLLPFRYGVSRLK